MALVCPSCHYRAQHATVFECPRCAIDLEESATLRPERRVQKLRSSFQVRQNPKRTRRRTRADVESR
jgi:transcription initiation factor IIE alpha subunit